MRPVKRVEIVVEAIELNNVIKALDRIGVVGYTLIRHVGGRGERGERRADEFSYELENVYLTIACSESQVTALIEASPQSEKTGWHVPGIRRAVGDPRSEVTATI